MKISAREIANFTDGYIISGEPETIFSGVSTDSRSILPDQLFIALRGDNYNGHSFIKDAVSRGASGVVFMEDLPRNGIVMISVEDTMQALGDIALGVRNKFDTAIIGVTGSTGKTTVKELCASIFSLQGTCLKTEKNYNNLIGVPLSLLALGPEYEFAIIEMGTNRFGEIDRLSFITRPQVSIITNINPVHLNGLRSISGIIKEKQAIFKNTVKCGMAVINPSLEHMDKIEIPNHLQVITYSHKDSADITLTHIEHQGLDGSDIEIDLAGKLIKTHVPLPGMHNVINALGACACAVALNLDPEIIAEGVRRAKFPGMRSEIIVSDHLTIINDCYNANPASMRAALSMLVDAPHSIKVAVLGDMLELGKDTQFWHEELGKWVAESGLDRLICIGEMAHFVCDKATKSGMEGTSIYPVQKMDEILYHLQDLFDKDAMVLIKASRALKLDQVVNQLKAVA
jgi:UDP-N-acetylmuramoyl-tripeptide--D-alanyl-D-alanine ligase